MYCGFYLEMEGQKEFWKFSFVQEVGIEWETTDVIWGLPHVFFFLG